MAYGAETSAQIDIKKSQMTSKRLSAALVGRIRGYPCVEEVDNPVNLFFLLWKPLWIVGFISGQLTHNLLITISQLA